MPKELIVRILQQYNLAPVQILDVQKGYRNESYAATLADGRTVNCILYKREPNIVATIQNANYVSNFLSTLDIPVRHTIDPRIIRLQNGGLSKYGALYNYLPGTTIPWEAYTMEHLKLLGGAMSDMHAALRRLPQGQLPSVTAQCGRIAEIMEKYFEQPGVRRALSAKLHLQPPDVTRLQSALSEAAKLPGQALHMDFVRGNILFSGTKPPVITGILDFEKTAWGSPVFDIARTVAFLLVDCKYKEEAKVRKYFLQSGYNKRGKSTFNTDVLLEELLNLFLTYDFYKFLRHNPYEYLPQNEHFVRTRDLLLKRNIIAANGMLK